MRLIGCQALSMSGRKCGAKVRLVAVKYHGYSQLYGPLLHRPEPSWVQVYLCPKHRAKRGKR